MIMVEGIFIYLHSQRRVEASSLLKWCSWALNKREEAAEIEAVEILFKANWIGSGMH